MWPLLVATLLLSGGDAADSTLTISEEMRILDAIAEEVEEQRERDHQALVEAQERLGWLGWYRGVVDGIHGPLTEAAIERFADEVGVEPEVEVVLVALRLDSAPEPPPPPAPVPAPDPEPAPEPVPAPDPEPAPEPEPAPAPATRNVWDRLAECESGNWIDGGSSFERGSARWYWGRPGTDVPSWGSTRFHGGLQFHPGTWSSYRLDGYPQYAYDATREQQIAVAERVLAAQGWGAWPTCTQKLGLR